MKKRERVSDSAIFISLTSASQSLASFFVLFLLVRILSISEFSLAQWCWLIIVTSASIGTVGIPIALLYFIPRMERVNDQRKFIADSIYLIVLCALFIVTPILLIAYFLADVSSAAMEFAYLLLMFPIIISDIIKTLIRHAFVSIGRSKYSLYTTFLYTIVYMILSTSFAYIFKTATSVLLANIIALLVANVVGFIILNRVLPASKEKLSESSSPSKIEVMRYCVPIWLSSITGELNRRLDGLLISSYFPIEVFGKYSVGSRELPFVSIFPYSITQAVVPVISENASSGYLDRVLFYINGSIRKSALLIIPLFAFLWVFSEEFISIVFTPKYKEAASVFSVYLLLLPLRFVAYGMILSALGKGRIVFRGAFLALISNMVLSITAIRYLGWLGPAYGSIISQGIMIIYFLKHIKKSLGVSVSDLIPYWMLFRIILTSVILVSACSYIVKYFGFYTDLSVFVSTAIIYFPFYIMAMYFLRILEPEDRKLVLRWIKLEPFRKT